MRTRPTDTHSAAHGPALPAGAIPGREQRRDPRVRARLGVALRLPGSGRATAGATRDLSAIGALIELPPTTPAHENTQVELAIDWAGVGMLGDDLLRPARVVRVTHTPQATLCAVEYRPRLSRAASQHARRAA
ncbi:MAG: hypothetical protein C0475_08165 [Planctomyces sp.]|nr:hypothetical protein [Planctomyces sp.]MBA4039745.1 hypothetical protein [Planctomyces sp.]MBA4119893.1 hypothetical protein [Isosphaera sp.]